MEAFLRYARKIMLAMAGLGIVAAALLLKLTAPAELYGSPWVNGYLLGLAAGIFAFWYIDVRAVVEWSKIDPGDKGAGKLYFRKMLKSVLVFGGVLLVGFAGLGKDYFQGWAALLGLVTPRLVLVVDSTLWPNRLAPPAAEETAAAAAPPAAPPPLDE